MKDNMRDEIEKLASENKISLCEKCRGKMNFIGRGKYKCTICNHEEFDELGKVKEYLRENGTAPLLVIAQATGVKQKMISSFLKDGSLEIPEGADYYIKCEKCGCNIRYGRFCSECVKELAGGIKSIFNAEAGEKPKCELNIERTGKMRYMDRRTR